tara:strand:- start:1044 stop:1262 length:219 start_codon:yes stop_codon:yes gene_type:complete
MATTARVTNYYLLGITEGRAYFKVHGAEDAQAHIENCETTLASHSRHSALHQMALGERDFWAHKLNHTDEAA